MINIKKLLNFFYADKTNCKVLKDGEDFNVSKATKVRELYLRQGWTINISEKNNEPLDIDAYAFLCLPHGSCPDIHHMVHFNSQHQDYKAEYSMEHIFTKEEINKDLGTVTEWQDIKINLDLIPEKIKNIDFAVAIFNPGRDKFLSRTTNNFISLLIKDESTGTKNEICRSNINNYCNYISTEMYGTIYRKDENWVFNSSPKPIIGDINDLMDNYGVVIPMKA
jgi:Uncharacterized proteins involved in stress response, homologs of TerZ and putative cAMP-binding protein CABP1